MLSHRPRSIILLLAALNACAGNVSTTPLAPGSIRNGKEITGLIVYPPMLAKLTFKFLTRVDDSGKLIADVGGCSPAIQKEELTVLPDFAAPMQLKNSSGFLSGAKFSVTLVNGMVSSVNAEPTEKASDILTALGTAIPAFRKGANAQELVCNAGPVLSAIERASIGTRK